MTRHETEKLKKIWEKQIIKLHKQIQRKEAQLTELETSYEQAFKQVPVQ